jgi:hypothetical protein
MLAERSPAASIPLICQLPGWGLTWNIYGPNYRDKTSHWSEDDVIGGVARLRYERKQPRPVPDMKILSAETIGVAIL